MIGYFPTPYPDELFYSLCARFSDRMQYTHKSAVCWELFNVVKVTVSVDFPQRLGAFVAALPPQHICKDPERLFTAHTLLPLYAPFLTKPRLQHIQAAMLDGTGPAAHMYTGLNPSPIPRYEWFRFCPICVREDRQQFDECYWHRVHQISGVLVCPTHEVWLEESSVYAGNSALRYDFIAAERTIAPQPQAVSISGHPYAESFLQIARDAAWLLAQTHLVAEASGLRPRYLAALIAHHWATYAGIIKRQTILAAFRDHYAPDFLARLHCQLDEKIRENWLIRLLSPRVQFQHPLHHLLCIHLLGHTIASFVSLPPVFQPFGAGPWPCLNRVCEHYRQPWITQCQISYDDHNRPVGTFACTCGFTYLRRGPDTTPADCFRVGRHVTFGPLWETKLRQLWQDPHVSLVQIAERLGVDRSIVTRQAVKLGLPFPHPGSRVPQPPVVDAQAIFATTQQQHRTKLLATMHENPDFSRMALQQQIPKTYTWLMHHDREWLMTHLPPRKNPSDSRTCLPSPRVDWEQRDAQLAAEVQQAAQYLKNLADCSERVTRQSIFRHLCRPHLTPEQLLQLPGTAAILAEVVETYEEFAIRRISWAAILYRQEQTIPTRSQLLTRARVKNTIVLRSPAIQAALETTLQTFHSPQDLTPPMETTT